MISSISKIIKRFKWRMFCFNVGWTRVMFAFGHRFAIGFFNTDFTK